MLWHRTALLPLEGQRLLWRALRLGSALRLPSCRPHAMSPLEYKQVVAHAGEEAPAEGVVKVPEPEHVTGLTYTGLLPSCSAMDAVHAAR